MLFRSAGYTYGPLLGLFVFSMTTSRRVRETAVPWVAVCAPLLCAVLDMNQRALWGAYEMGLELLVVNGALTFVGLWLCSKPDQAVPPTVKPSMRSVG